MSAGYAVAWGLLLGALGAAWHLALTWVRARWVTSGRPPALVYVLLPVALAGPALAVIVAARSSPVAAWVAVAGIVLVRSVALRRLRAARGKG